MPRLRRSNTGANGITRRRCGRGFLYRTVDGTKLDDKECLRRIRSLAIPPAWTDVWICPWPNGHIQAMGTDAAGRRQYRYHDDWRKRKDQEKFERAIEFGRALPTLLRRVEDDLAAPGLRKQRMLAVGVRLLHIGGFRIGGEEYAEEHETFGVATLQVRHVRIDGDRVIFTYNAKGSIKRNVAIDDLEILRAMRSLLRRSRRRGDDLLAWRQGAGWRNLRSTDLNAYIKETIGDQFSAKDFRTWSATVRAASELATRADEAASERQRKRTVKAAVAEVADHLGNTPAVCRSSYIDPRVIDCFHGGDTIGPALATSKSSGHSADRRIEKAVIAMLTRSAEAA
jgi:DNA topoisomerase-1